MPNPETSQASKYAPPNLLSQSRVTIENVQPQVDEGAFPSKRVLGEKVRATASIHTDGHNAIGATLQYRKTGESEWQETPMELKQPGLDLFEGVFEVTELGYYEFTISAWIDAFTNWSRDTKKKLAAGQDVTLELTEGAVLINDAVKDAPTNVKAELLKYAAMLDTYEYQLVLQSTALHELMHKYSRRGRVREYNKILSVMVESERALYGAWYELFPRSVTNKKEKHGTFKDVIAHLPYVEDMGFDVIYLPPIHPIGTAARKGPNNTLTPGPNDVGSPWAIGAKEGGHKAIHPELGTLADFHELINAAAVRGIDIALDIAFQCSPDHPYVSEHPEWFYRRPDGSIRCAENPPKRYEDIYPIDFECDDWEALWEELKDVVVYWAQQGVKVFRVDNPHTKPYPFWHYLIREVKRVFPETVFLSEAFARPKVMAFLAKCGFSQSYTYFTWRNNKEEITTYFNELYNTELADYLRPNLFANTPDILPDFLQYSGRSGFMIRAALAATLGATYGIYGPPFELCVTDSMPNAEEYKDSEKYEIRTWNLDDPHSIKDFITRLNKIRRANIALHANRNLKFLNIDNREMIAYTKSTEDGANTILVVVNLDPHHTQSGYLQIPFAELGADQSFQVHDLITGVRFFWTGDTNFVQLDPHVSPAYVFKVLRKLKSERDFDYFA